jgi:hypothetical protein
MHAERVGAARCILLALLAGLALFTDLAGTVERPQDDCISRFRSIPRCSLLPFQP